MIRELAVKRLVACQRHRVLANTLLLTHRACKSRSSQIPNASWPTRRIHTKPKPHSSVGRKGLDRMIEKASAKDAALRLREICKMKPMGALPESVELWNQLVEHDHELAWEHRIAFYTYLRRVIRYRARNGGGGGGGGDMEPAATMIKNIYYSIPSDLHVKEDYQAVGLALWASNELGMVTPEFVEAANRLSAGRLMTIVKELLALCDGNDDYSSGFRFDLLCQVLVTKHPQNALLDDNTYQQERQQLRSFLADDRSKFLDRVAGTTSELMTCFIDLCVEQPDGLALARSIFDTKVEQGNARPIDLHRVLTGYMQAKLFENVVELYNKHPELQTSQHYDVLLTSYAMLEQWDKLQELFESLFDIDSNNLPSIKHYSIVMQALATVAQVDVVEMLHQGLVDRKMTPNTETLNAVLYANYAFGDTAKVARFLDREFSRFGVEPNVQSYTILMNAYCQSRDMDAALKLRDYIYGSTDVQVGSKILLPLMNLCAKRRDPVQAKQLMSWIETHDLEPSQWIYNGLIHCLAESNLIAQATKVFERMRAMDSVAVGIDTITALLNAHVRLNHLEQVNELVGMVDQLGLQPDGHYYAVLLRCYCHVKNCEIGRAKKLFDDLLDKKQVAVTAYHYVQMMQGYLAAGRSDDAIALYDRMVASTVTPTFDAHAVYFRALTKSQAPEWHEKCQQLLIQFLQSKDLLDLTSDYLTRDKVPPAMLKPVILRALSEPEGEQFASRVMQMYYRADPNAVNNITVLQLDIQVRLALGDWQSVQEIWNKLGRLLEECMVEDEEIPGRFTVPPRYRQAAARSANAIIVKHGYNSQLDQIKQVVAQLDQLGLSLNNSNLNTMIRMFLANDDYLFRAMDLAEGGGLINGYLTRVSKSARIHTGQGHSDIRFPRHYLFRSTMSLLVNAFRRVVRLIVEEQACDEEEAIVYLSKQYPLLVKTIQRQLDRRQQLQLQ